VAEEQPEARSSLEAEALGLPAQERQAGGGPALGREQPRVPEREQEPGAV
jgi:hypothetical protein